MRIPRDRILDLTAMVESYDNIGVVRTLNSVVGDVAILTTKNLLSDFIQLVLNIAENMNITRLEWQLSDFKKDWLLGSCVGYLSDEGLV